MKAKQQSGFTLIELVMVIVILGILSAVAIPQFVNLQVEARTAATQGIAGALASASTINFAARSANPTRGIAITGDLAGCQAHATLLQGGALPGAPDYTIGGAAPACTITHTATGSTAVAWTAIVIP